MAPSSSDTGNAIVAVVDRLLLGGMALGVLLMLQPVWADGLKWGFFVTFGSTILEIVTGHMLSPTPRA